MRYLVVLCIGLVCAFAVAEEATRPLKLTSPKKYFSNKVKPSNTDSTTAAAVTIKDQSNAETSTAATLDKAGDSNIPKVAPNESSLSEEEKLSRKKKSTTTTFCVEIRPSNPYQRPFQVCEPDYKYAPVYGVPMASIPSMAPTPTANGFSMGNQPSFGPSPGMLNGKPGLVPVSAFAAPSAAAAIGPIPFMGGKIGYNPHAGPSYSSAKSANSDSENENGKTNDNFPNKVTSKAQPATPTSAASPAPAFGAPSAKPVSEENKAPAAAAFGPVGTSFRNEDMSREDASESSNEEEHMPGDPQNARSAGGYDDEYGGGYGGYQSHVTYITHVKPKKLKLLKKKDKKLLGHNGVVITCQPSLAGYASSPPHYGGSGYGSEYGRSYSGPSYHSKPAYASPDPYNPPAAYGSKPSFGSSFEHSNFAAPKPLAVISAHEQPFPAHFGAGIIEGPAFSAPASIYGDSSFSGPHFVAPAPVFSEAAFALNAPFKPVHAISASKFNAPAYSAPAYSAPAFAAPGFSSSPVLSHFGGSSAYRAAEGSLAGQPANNMGLTQHEKEKHTIQHMQEVSNNRPAHKEDHAIEDAGKATQSLIQQQGNAGRSQFLSTGSQPPQTVPSNFRTSGWSADAAARAAGSVPFAPNGGWQMQARTPDMNQHINQAATNTAVNQQIATNPSVLTGVSWNEAMAARSMDNNHNNNVKWSQKMDQQKLTQVSSSGWSARNTESQPGMANNLLSSNVVWAQNQGARASDNTQTTDITPLKVPEASGMVTNPTESVNKFGSNDNNAKEAPNHRFDNNMEKQPTETKPNTGSTDSQQNAANPSG